MARQEGLKPMRPFIARQGDVLLVLVDSLPEGATEVPRDGAGRIVLALGEVTGHAHAVHETGAKLWSMPDNEVERRFLEITEASALVHEEHQEIHLEPGVYEVRRQREYVSADRPTRRVVD